MTSLFLSRTSRSLKCLVTRSEAIGISAHNEVEGKAVRTQTGVRPHDAYQGSEHTGTTISSRRQSPRQDHVTSQSPLVPNALSLDSFSLPIGMLISNQPFSSLYYIMI